MRLSPLGLFVPSTSLVHRAPPGVKLIGLAVCGLMFVLWSGPLSTAGALALGLSVVLLARLHPLRVLWRLRPIVVLLLALILYHAWSTTLVRGIEVAGDLLALVLLAVVFTASTRTDDLIDVLVRAATQLSRLPLLGRFVNPAVLAISITLMLRTIPTLGRISSEVRAAAQARGLSRSPRALLVPFAVRTVAHAVDSGQALTARGLVD